MMMSAWRSLNHVIAGLCIAIGCTPPLAAHAQAKEPVDYHCVQRPVDIPFEYTPNLQVARCTAAIQSGALSRKELAQAL